MNYPAPPLARTALPLEAFKIFLRESCRHAGLFRAGAGDKDIVDISACTQTLPGRRPAKDVAILSD